MQPWALVTPASRGIGLELARRLLRTTDIPIVTSARKDLDQTRENVLSGLEGVSEDRLHVLKVDVLGRFLIMSLRLRNSHLHARSLRRTDYHRCSLNNHIHVPEKVLLPSPRARRPRHPLPRKVAQPDRLQQCPAHLPGQYPRPHDAAQALLALPAQKSHNNRRTERPPTTRRMGQHERTRRKHRRQRTRRMVLVPRVKSSCEPGHKDFRQPPEDERGRECYGDQFTPWYGQDGFQQGVLGECERGEAV
jgi:hypothetical protein